MNNSTVQNGMAMDLDISMSAGNVRLLSDTHDTTMVPDFIGKLTFPHTEVFSQCLHRVVLPLTTLAPNNRKHCQYHVTIGYSSLTTLNGYTGVASI